MYPIPYHPAEPTHRRDWKGKVWHFSRTQRPVRYFFIDFGLSRRYSPADGPPRELPILPADKSVPEFQGAHYNEMSDPFATDVYLIGNAIRQRFTNVGSSSDIISQSHSEHSYSVLIRRIYIFLIHCSPT